jgi:hypothetical protein
MLHQGLAVLALIKSNSKLIISLKTAVEKGEGSLDKDTILHDGPTGCIPFVPPVLALTDG